MANFPTWQEWQLLSEDERKVYGDNYNAWVAEKENQGVLKSYGGTEVAKPYERTWAKDVRPQLVVEGILPRTDISETLSAGRMGPVSGADAAFNQQSPIFMPEDPTTLMSGAGNRGVSADVDTRLLPAATAETISAPISNPLQEKQAYMESVDAARTVEEKIPRYEADLWSSVNEALQAAIPTSGRYGTKKAAVEQLRPGLDVAAVAPAIMPFNPAVQSLSGEERQWRRGRQEEELLQGLLRRA